MSNRIKVFTDGSSDPRSNKGSWAGIILYDTEKKVLTGFEADSSQHKMELLGILKCLKYIELNCKTDDEIWIYTDSEYVTNLPGRRKKLEHNNFKTKKGKTVVHHELIQEFFEYLDKYSIFLTRVPSHQKKGVSDISDYNREVDKLSRKILRDTLRSKG